MKELSKKEFLSLPGENNIALCVTNNETMFIGWQEEAENYNLVLAKRIFPIKKDERTLVDAITNSDGWQSPMSVCQVQVRNPKNSIMSLLKDFKILSLTDSEWKKATLTDGKYIVSLRGCA